MFVRKKKNRSGSTSIQIIQKINRINKILKTKENKLISVSVNNYHYLAGIIPLTDAANINLGEIIILQTI